MKKSFFLHLTSTTILLLSSTTFIVVKSHASESSTKICNEISLQVEELNTDISFDNMDYDQGSPFVRDRLVQDIVWTEEINFTKEAIWDGVNSHKKVGYLPYKGDIYTIFAYRDSGAGQSSESSGALVSRVYDKSNLLCKFNPTLDESSTWATGYFFSKHKQNIDCKELIDKKHLVQTDTALVEGQEDALFVEMGIEQRPGWFKKNAYSKPHLIQGDAVKWTDGPIIHADINNDGSDEKLIRINFSESTNSPCDTHYYDLLSEDGMSLGDAALRERLFEAQNMPLGDDGYRKLGCGRNHEIIQFNERFFISGETKLSRFITSIEPDDVKQVCKSTYSTKMQQ